MYHNNIEEKGSNKPEGTLEQHAFIRFNICGSYYALNIQYINEVVEIPIITPYPVAIPGHLGVVNLSGQILPIIDFTHEYSEQNNTDLLRASCLLLVVSFIKNKPFGLIIKQPHHVQVPTNLLETTTVNIGGAPVRILDQNDFEIMECQS